MLDTLRYWVRGVRFYIACGTLLITLETVWWVHTAYGGSALYPTRTEEVYAWLAVGFLTIAVSIGPAYKLFPKLPARRVVEEARRWVGISAAWFSLLHVLVAYFTLFKGSNPLQLPKVYQESFLVGAIALLILLAMALTSFDKAFKSMGIWWFRLHRLVYVAIVLILLHAFLIGVHATNLPVLIILCGLVGLLLFAYVWIAFVRKRPTRWQLITITTMAILLIAVLYYGFSQHFSAHPAAGAR